MFKIGEKVVFVGYGAKPIFKGFRCPKVGEIVTIHAYCTVHKGFLDISEYLRDNNGRLQSFNPLNFRKLDEIENTNWVEELLEKVIKEVNEEELILVD